MPAALIKLFAAIVIAKPASFNSWISVSCILHATAYIGGTQMSEATDAMGEDIKVVDDGQEEDRGGNVACIRSMHLRQFVIVAE
ncbi:hypothetical protein PpBr36_01386 [Pyricularia pennisetigena]|uniref:hypothetical protein n=1 Tax=Pyricularia pennisetigena TaxID=1578925 RepID=UPI00114ECE40|nr:hypothetical protein PpBr36_01386 [Pyricularia pennisetigena]TLS29086.1 hypothetical protein PpBr36_01386 [Pyricularia pennisetigena]